MDDKKREYFLEIFEKAEKKYGKSVKRLAAEGWKENWQVLISTILSARNRDEITISVCKELFEKYDLKGLAEAPLSEIGKDIRKINFWENKSRYIKETARILFEKYGGKVPNEIDKLVELPGVGRKTANLVLSTCFSKDTITCDTHVIRISNVFGFVDSENPDIVERELKKIAPEEYWSKINRIFVLWGQDVKGRDKEKFLRKLEE